jgi:hypothetical protein
MWLAFYFITGKQAHCIIDEPPVKGFRLSFTFKHNITYFQAKKKDFNFFLYPDLFL